MHHLSDDTVTGSGVDTGGHLLGFVFAGEPGVILRSERTVESEIDELPAPEVIRSTAFPATVDSGVVAHGTIVIIVDDVKQRRAVTPTMSALRP